VSLVVFKIDTYQYICSHFLYYYEKNHEYSLSGAYWKFSWIYTQPVKGFHRQELRSWRWNKKSSTYLWEKRSAFFETKKRYIYEKVAHVYEMHSIVSFSVFSSWVWGNCKYEKIYFDAIKKELPLSFSLSTKSNWSDTLKSNLQSQVIRSYRVLARRSLLHR